MQVRRLIRKHSSTRTHPPTGEQRHNYETKLILNKNEMNFRRHPITWTSARTKAASTHPHTGASAYPYLLPL